MFYPLVFPNESSDRSISYFCIIDGTLQTLARVNGASIIKATSIFLIG